MDDPNRVTRQPQEPTLPNLLILGAAKSGTSSLYSYLAQHPAIFMSPFKEPTFFVWEGRPYDVQGPGIDRIRRPISDLDSYLQLFSSARDAPIRGEASTGYLHTPGVAERIRRYVPEARLMAILRNPVDRAYSAFLHTRREGIEPIPDFRRAIAEEPQRVTSRWVGLTLYTTVGMYAQQLDRYLALFRPEQIRVYLYDDLVRNPLPLVQDAFRFLEIDDTFEPNIAQRLNVGVSVRSPGLYRLGTAIHATSFVRRFVPRRFARGLQRMINERPKEELPQELRKELANVFEPDIQRLSRQLDRNLAPWLEGKEIPAPRRGAGYGSQPRAIGR